MPVPRSIKNVGQTRELHMHHFHPTDFRDMLRVPPGGGFTSMPGDGHVLREIIATGELVKIDLTNHIPEAIRHKRVPAENLAAWKAVEAGVCPVKTGRTMAVGAEGR